MTTIIIITIIFFIMMIAMMAIVADVVVNSNNNNNENNLDNSTHKTQNKDHDECLAVRKLRLKNRFHKDLTSIKHSLQPNTTVRKLIKAKVKTGQPFDTNFGSDP